MVDCALAQVDDVAGNFATVLAADGGKVKVKLARPADFDSTFVEFVGTVDAPNQISEMDRTSFGNTFGAPHRVNLGLPSVQNCCYIGVALLAARPRDTACTPYIAVTVPTAVADCIY